jgi:hypothetical protein
MAYLKPPAFTRHLANPLAMRLGARGVATLTVAGYRTGELHKVPVIPVEVAGSRHLVSPYGESDWVRSLRAAGRGELSSNGQTEIFQATEVPVEEREIVIARYREVAGDFVGPCLHQSAEPQSIDLDSPSKSATCAVARRRPSTLPRPRQEPSTGSRSYPCLPKWPSRPAKVQAEPCA